MPEIILCTAQRPSRGLRIEVVAEVDDALPLDDTTPRTVTVSRLFTRGDLAVLVQRGLSRWGYTAPGFPDVVATPRAHSGDVPFVGATIDLHKRDSVIYQRRVTEHDAPGTTPARRAELGALLAATAEKAPVGVNWPGGRVISERSGGGQLRG